MINIKPDRVLDSYDSEPMLFTFKLNTELFLAYKVGDSFRVDENSPIEINFLCCPISYENLFYLINNQMTIKEVYKEAQKVYDAWVDEEYDVVFFDTLKFENLYEPWLPPDETIG